MKILYVTTIGITMGFFKSLIKELIDEGHCVDIICNETDERVPDCYREWGCKVYHHSCSRSPLSKGNLDAIREIKKVVTENKYDIVHCHTPIASVCTRLACRRLRKQGLKVIYTAHGFHFYKGAPLLNWLVYYPLEKLCANFTDTLITINKEDYELAKKKMNAKRVEYVPGVGIDVDKFRNTVVDRAAKRRELGIPEDAFLLFSVGELNKNKNHQILIRALKLLKSKKYNLLIAGEGTLKESLSEMAHREGVGSQVHFLGYRHDIPELLQACDLYLLPSIREGLNVSLIEAIASNTKVVASNIRGNEDLVVNGENGYLYDLLNINELVWCIKNVQNLKSDSCNDFNQFDVIYINQKMKNVYKNF